MEMFLPVNLLSLSGVQGNTVQMTQTDGSEEAFQLLLESFLLQTVGKELLKNNKGLFQGLSLDLFQGEEEVDNNSEHLLGFLELLQVPLMEQLRPIQEKPAELLQEGVPQEADIEFLLSNTQATGQNSWLNHAIAKDQGFLINLPMAEGEENPIEGSLQILKADENESTLVDPDANSRIGATGGEKHPPLFDRNPSNKEDGASQLMAEQNVQSQRLGEGIERLEKPTEFISKPSFQEVREQIIQSGKLKQFGEKSEIEIRLKPEYLGRLAIKIAVENGALTARFLVENHQVGRILEQNMANLRQTLTEQGIDLEQVQVEIGDPRSSSHGEKRDWYRGGTKRQTVIEDISQNESLEQGVYQEHQISISGIDYRA